MSYREEWKEVKLGEISKFSYGKLPKKALKGKGEFPIFTGYKYDNYYVENNCKKGDVIIVARGVGGTGDVKIVREKCFLTNLSIKATFDKSILSNLYFYYKFLLRNLKYLDSGSAQSQITIKDLQNIKIQLPPLPTQNRIASILSAFDEKIEVNRQMNVTLEAMAQAMFREMCLPKDEEALEEGWEWRTLKDDFNLNMGQSPKGSTYNEEGEGMIFFQGKRDFGKRFPKVRVYTTEPKRIAEKGDCLLSVRAPVGTLNIALEKCCIGRGLAAISHKMGFHSFCFYTLQNFEKQFISYDGEGTVFGSINKTTLGNLKYPKPPNNVIECFENLVKPIDERIRNNTLENQALAKSRDLLLPKLMSGEIEV